MPCHIAKPTVKGWPLLLMARFSSHLKAPRGGGFLVSDAAIGPDHRLFVLERAHFGPGGFATRLRRFDPPDPLSHETAVLQTEPGVHDNLEGLASWRDAKGLRATMVSDDNFSSLLRSEIVEYRLPD